jgi:hypothetical protein
MRDAKSILDTPPAEWEALAREATPQELKAIVKDLEGAAEHLARAAAYFGDRECGFPHMIGVLSSQRVSNELRRAHGFTTRRTITF